jgi:purine-binding chemotaxis protein CheW
MNEKPQVTNQKPHKSAKPLPREIAVGEEAKIVELIIFNLGDEEFGTEISQVREIIRKGKITPLPDSPAFIEGVTNVRGEITVVIDLRARLFLLRKKEVESKHVVITEQEQNLYGIMVDEVTEVIRIPEREIRSTPELVIRIDRKYIRGVITLENRLIILLDIAKVLSEEELTKLAAISQKHREAKEAKEDKKIAKKAPEKEIAEKKTEEPADDKNGKKEEGYKVNEEEVL